MAVGTRLDAWSTWYYSVAPVRDFTSAHIVPEGHFRVAIITVGRMRISLVITSIFKWWLLKCQLGPD